MNILVSGSAGFIGSHLVDRLKPHYGVTEMDKKLGSTTADYRQLYDKVAQDRPDIIVHLGANCSSQVSLRTPMTDFTDNVIGTFNVCEVARQLDVPVIFNSTMKVYPGDDGLIPPYGLSKLTGESYLKMYGRIYNLPYIVNRPSSVYGSRQDGSEDGGWFTWMIKAALENKQITLFGNGEQSRDMLYIDDCIDLLVDQIENFDLYQNQEFDFGGGIENEVSLNQLLNELDYHNTKTDVRLPGDVKRFVAGYDKISQVNGWKPKVSWHEGLERTKDWLLSLSPTI